MLCNRVKSAVELLVAPYTVVNLLWLLVSLTSTHKPPGPKTGGFFIEEILEAGNDR